MAVTVSKHSRLQFDTLLTDSGMEFWDTLDLPDIPVQNDDIQYTAISNDRIELLAYQFYGDPGLWWVIALANNLELLPTALYNGQLLRIPSPTYILQTFFQAGNG
jgi:nucleoid-associated protein YgaU